MVRIQISKKQRFEVFKRNSFVCQYCGNKPPSVVLEVDHILAVANGGSNDCHNLITSCFDCNRGKGREALAITPIDVKALAERLEEKREQVKHYERLLRADRRILDKKIDRIATIFSDAFVGFTLTDSARTSVGRFLKHLPEPIISEAMEKAVRLLDQERAFLYFCGICWKIIKGSDQ